MTVQSLASIDFENVTRQNRQKLRKVFQILGYNVSTGDKLVALIMEHL